MPRMTKTEDYLVALALMNCRDLAQQHFTHTEVWGTTGDDVVRKVAQRSMNAVDAIGYLRFPEEWEKARDSAGMDQTAGVE